MQIEMIEVEEIQEYRVPLEYGFYSEVYYQLFRFFSTHDQNKLYCVNADVDSVKDHEYFAFDSTDIYKFYGIFYQRSHDSLFQIEEKNYMLILEAEHVQNRETLLKYVEEKKAEFGCSTFASCGVKIDTTSLDAYEINSIALLLMEVLPNCTVLNAPLVYKSVYVDETLTEDPENIVYINELVTPPSSLSENNSQRIHFLLKILDEIRSDCNPKHVFTYKLDSCLTSDEIAIILAISESCLSKKVHASGIVLSKYTNYLTALFRRENMYLHDYIAYLRNFPDCTIALNKTPYLLIQNKAAMHEAKMTLHCLELPFDLEHKEILSKEVQTSVNSFDQIREVNISKLFNLDNKDFTIASKNSKKVQKIFYEMMGYINEFTNELNDILLNISNVLIYEKGERCYIAYVSEIVATCPFLVFPLAPGYSFFKTNLDLMSNIFYDVRSFSDYLAFVYPYIKRGLIQKNKMFMVPPYYYKGMLLQAITTTNELIASDCGLTYEEIGVWSTETTQTRYHPIALELWTREFVEDSFATIYGGPHPFEINFLNISMDAWR